MRALVESWSVDTDFVVAHAASALAGLAPDKVATFKAWLQSRIDNEKAGTANSLADLLMAALNGKALGRGGDGSATRWACARGPVDECGCWLPRPAPR